MKNKKLYLKLAVLKKSKPKITKFFRFKQSYLLSHIE